VPMPRHSRQSATVGGLRGWKVRTANDTLASVWCLFKNRTQDAALFDLTGRWRRCVLHGSADRAAVHLLVTVRTYRGLAGMLQPLRLLR
jgi:hypothetical protein